MQSITIPLWTPEEYRHPLSFGFLPSLTLYLHEDSSPRPCVVIAPGGGYEYLCVWEGEPVALAFYRMGYQAAVCTYTTNLATGIAVGTQAMEDLSRSVRLLRHGARQYQIDPERVAVCGFSAGGHLCGSLCVHYRDIADSCYPDTSNRPDAAILAYPVITSGVYAHRESFVSLLGPSPSREELNYFSLEKQVKRDTPPCFLWQTMHDSIVPIQNSSLFAQACAFNQVPYAHHIFTTGAHGIGLGDEDWAAGNYGGSYVEQQCMLLTQRVRSGSLSRPGRDLRELDRFDNHSAKAALASGRTPFPEVAMWPVLADCWLKQTYPK